MICENGSHLALWDDEDAFFEGVTGFVRDVEQGRSLAERILGDEIPRLLDFGLDKLGHRFPSASPNHLGQRLLRLGLGPVDGLQCGQRMVQDAAVASNADWVFWRVSLASELALDETILPHGLELWVDTDNNPNTGWIQSQMGVELVLDFASNEVRRYNAGGVETTLSFNNIGLHGAPTYSGSAFELALDRGMSGVGSASLSWQWVDTSNDEVLPADPAVHVLDNTHGNTPQRPLSAERHPASGHVVERQSAHGPVVCGGLHGAHGCGPAAGCHWFQ